MKVAAILLALVWFFPLFADSDLPSDKYKLAWSDEFDGTELDLSKWDYRGLGPRRDAINVKDCVALDGEGRLILSTKRSGDEYHTAMIGTQGKYEACYGYFECRVKLQTQLGHWSAFWLQSPKFIDGGDPENNGTEIDIFEYLIKNGKTILFNLHWGGYGKEYHQTAGSSFEMKETPDGYHVVALEWTPNEYVFYVDGQEAWRTGKGVSQIKQYIILSLEVGEWAGDIQQAALPDSAVFDYVRVYQIPSNVKY
ncbi:MAG: glycoside hydrolase family 16 protein [Candidatus Omnitrophica bacterium]|nr:glycoside hydrolase family 16 protein [Candidatus Omnitrophota bacterium]